MSSSKQAPRIQRYLKELCLDSTIFKTNAKDVCDIGQMNLHKSRICGFAQSICFLFDTNCSSAITDTRGHQLYPFCLHYSRLLIEKLLWKRPRNVRENLFQTWRVGITFDKHSVLCNAMHAIIAAEVRVKGLKSISYHLKSCLKCFHRGKALLLWLQQLTAPSLIVVHSNHLIISWRALNIEECICPPLRRLLCLRVCTETLRPQSILMSTSTRLKMTGFSTNFV